MKKFKFILFCLFFLISFYITGSKILNTSLINYLIYNEEQISSIKYNNMLKEISKNIVNNMVKETKFLDKPIENNNNFSFVNLVKKDDYKVYIYNTHDEESYSNKGFELYNTTPTVKLASYMLKDELNNLGINALVEERPVIKEIKKQGLPYHYSYDISNKYCKEIKEKYPSIIYFIDLHRDGIDKSLSTVTINNKTYAKMMFLLGMKHSNSNKNLEVVTKLNNYLNIFLEFIGIFVMIIILEIIYRSNLDNIIVYILYYNYFKECVYYFITFNVSYSYLKLVIDRINGVYYLKNYDKSKGLEFKNDDIIINDLSYSYGLNKVFDKINYKIKVGSKVLIKGNNGSGKSTLINILTKNIDDYNGKVSIGYDIRDISYNSYLEHISYVNQDSGLFEDSIINNIVLNNETDNNKLDEIIKILNLDEVIKNKERGINTLIKDNFSGGEKQKIIIARCLYKCSDIMVFDEAFSEISSNDRINIINKINDVYRDKTIIYVNHFNDNIKYDQILEIIGTRKDKVDE